MTALLAARVSSKAYSRASRSPTPDLLVALGPNQVLFQANDGTFGNELWTSDGTGAGTNLLVDLNPAPSSGSPTSLCALGERVVFAATEPATGTELWISDGTPAGTNLVLDLRPGPTSSEPRGMWSLGTQVLFTADDGTRGRELWVTDGTTAGTALVKDLFPGSSGSDPVRGIVAFGFTLGSAKSIAPCAALIAGGSSRVPLGGACDLWITAPLVDVVMVSDAAGGALLPLPVPVDTALIGGELYLQWFVADPAGAALYLGTLSNALHLVIGL